MRLPRPVRRVLVLLAALVLPWSCYKGEGSFVPPSLPRTAESWLSGVVVDGDGKPITGARVSIPGTGATTATGRNGRFYLDTPPTGPRLVEVDGADATADGADRFPALRLLHPVAPGKGDLARVVVLPDLTTGTASTLALGSPLASPTTIDATATAGGRLVLSAGVVPSRAGATGNVDVTLTSVEVSQAPLDLPAAGAGVRIATRLLWVTPVDVTFAGGSRDLELANDLRLPATSATELYRLDPVSGTWNLVGAGVVQAGGTTIATSAGTLPGGGLYAFAASVATSTTVTGRVADQDGRPLPFARVCAEDAPAVTCDQQGAFTVPTVAAVDGSGAARNLRVRAYAPLGWSPAMAVQNTTPSGAATDAGLLGLLTWRVNGVRVLAVNRGVSLPDRRFRVGIGGLGVSGLTEVDGSLDRRDLPLGFGRAWTGYEEAGAMRTPDDLVREGVGDYDFVDFEAFVRSWNPRDLEAKDQNFLLVVDADYGGPIEGARVQASANTTSRSELTEEFGSLLFDNERFQDQTASFGSTAPTGRKVASAFTIGYIDNGRVEYPLRVARWPSPGAYEPFGLVDGALTGSVGGKDRRLTVQPLRYDNDWFDVALGGPTWVEDMPRLVDPDVAGTAYLVGLPMGRAAFSAAEGVVTGGVFHPERFGLVEGLVVTPGTRQALDLALAWPVDTALAVTSLASSLDAGYAVTDLRYRLALSDASGLAVDALPESGGVAIVGADLSFPVPTLTGTLAGRRYLLWAAATRVAAGATDRQEVLLASSGTTATSPGFSPLPRITAPAPGATVPKDKFTVQWTADPSAAWLELELSAEDGSDDRYWSVVLEPTRTSFEFGPLVNGAVPILTGGRSWTLTLRSARIDRGYLLGRSDVYQASIGNRFSIPAGHMGIQSRSSTSIAIQTAP
ncbi:MAG: hypothetical protein R3F30_06820 [Planctomycetota bacterium]